VVDAGLPEGEGEGEIVAWRSAQMMMMKTMVVVVVVVVVVEEGRIRYK